MEPTGENNPPKSRSPSRISFIIGDSSSDSDSVVSACSANLSSQAKVSSPSSVRTIPNVGSCSDLWHRSVFHRNVNCSDDCQAQTFPIQPDPEETDREAGRPMGNERVGIGRGTDGAANKWRVLIGCGLTNFFSAVNGSLQAPFYPAQAEKKGAAAIEYCAVFAVYELMLFIFYPVFGSAMHKLRPKLVFNLGLLTAATAAIIFGILDKVNGTHYYIGSCILARMIEGIGSSAMTTASVVITTSAFPDTVGPTIASVELFYAAGWTIGPILGSFLFQLGGFSYPFFVVGGALLVSGCVNFFILPSSEHIAIFQVRSGCVQPSFESFRLLKYFSILISALCMFLGSMSISYLQTTLEPHLRQFNVSQLATGGILIINMALYSTLSPILGKLCENMAQLKLLAFCGLTLVLVGFSLIGPLPIFPFEAKLWLICLGLFLQGIGLSLVFVSSTISIERDIATRGLPASTSPAANSSSLIGSLFSLGAFIGASLSGIFFSTLGFPLGTSFIPVLTIVTMLVVLVYMCIPERPNTPRPILPPETETDPLINSVSVSTSVYSANSYVGLGLMPCSSRTVVTRLARSNSRDYGAVGPR